MDEKLYIVIPAYNEEENIASVVKDWHPIVERHGDGRSKLLVINDGSTDSTASILDDLVRDYPLLEPVTKPNGGHGSSVLLGYRRALEEGADWVFQTDSDGQTLPSEFEDFWTARKRFDVIIGVRSTRQDGWQRKVVERVLCVVLWCFFGVKLKDANAPYRLMRAKVLSRHIGRLPKDFNLPNAVLTVYFVRFGESVSFREITFRPRQGGVNSINIKRIFGIGVQALHDFRRLSRDLKCEVKSSDASKAHLASN